MKINKQLLITIIILGSAILLDFTIQIHLANIRNKHHKEHVYYLKQIDRLSLDYISECISEYDIQHPDIVLAQCILESNIHNKDVITNNNLFGMKSAWVRTTVALNPKKYEYAKYSSIDSCILDYKLWQLQYANNLTRQQYLLKLEQIYASDSNYTKKLLNIITNERKFRNYKK